MRITVLGASGKVGQQIVTQGVAAGHEVTGVVRDSPGSAAARRTLEASGARLAVADVRDAGELKDAISGRDAVLSGLGPRARKDPARIASTGTRAALEAMDATGVRRIVVIGAAPVGAGGLIPPGGTAVYRRVASPLLWAAFRDAYADLARMEDLLAGSGVDWTSVRPPRLTNGPRTGRAKAVRGAVARGFLVSRADVAAAMLAALEDPTTYGTFLGISR